MASHEEMISQFTNVTGVDEERAKFYLESSAWQIEVALTSFYENDGDQNASSLEPEADQQFVESSSIQPQEKPSGSVQSEFQPEKAKPKKPFTANSRFATVQSLQAINSSDDEEEGQAFYAGGSEHSGQQVLGPGKKRDIVDEMFKSVQEHGAEVVDPGSDPRRETSTFGGTGYKLGQSANDSEVIQAAPSTSSRPTDVVLKLWRDGFSLNDGPLRDYQDPDNRDFLNSVRRGEIPHELIRQAHGSEVHLNMEDHRHDEFVQVKSKVKAFSGQGHLLGSPAPTVVSTPSVDPHDNKASEDAAKEAVKVDSSAPTTNIQIRLADGSRLLGHFNHIHTVNDIRQYITTARPQYQNREFVLLTTFPSHELSDGSQTLAQAGILNAAVMQRLK